MKYKVLSVFVLATVVSLSSPAHASDHKEGTLGLGWYSSSAPVGGRVWVTPQVGIDIGVGFADKNLLGGDSSRVHFNIGVPIDVVQTEHANFFIRPGYEFQSNSRVVGSEVKSTSIFTADLGVEWFVTDQFTLSVGHGLQFQQVNGSDNWGFSALRALSVENVGFHFYFSK